MKSTAYAALLGASAGIVQAQIGYDCDGSHFPNYEDCEFRTHIHVDNRILIVSPGDSVVDFYGFRDNTDVVAYNGEDGPEPSCTWWYWKDGNCRITNCWSITNDEAGSRLEQTGDNLARIYDGTKSVCQKLKAGGRSNSTPDENGNIITYTTVYNDPDRNPPSAKLRSRDGAPTPDRFVRETVTLAQHEQWVNDTQQRQSNRDLGPLARESKIQAAVKAAKRENGDDGYYINNTGKTVRQEGVFDTGPRASNGVTTMYSTTKSKTFTSTTSANIGAAFEIFSAGISYEYSESDSFSVTKGHSFTPDCAGNQQGQAFFYPFFDYYDVTFSPSGQRADVWLTVDAGDMFIQGEFEVQCLG
jgi:hypothetical protein